MARGQIWWRSFILAVCIGVTTLFVSSTANAQSGYQTINGTMVYTEVDQAAGVATFSNDCGSQTLTQGQLQAGAIPNRIIPCPRVGGASPQRSQQGKTENQLARENCLTFKELHDVIGGNAGLEQIRKFCSLAGMNDVLRKVEAHEEQLKREKPIRFRKKCLKDKERLQEILDLRLDTLNILHDIERECPQANLEEVVEWAKRAIQEQPAKYRKKCLDGKKGFQEDLDAHRAQDWENKNYEDIRIYCAFSQLPDVSDWADREFAAAKAHQARTASKEPKPTAAPVTSSGASKPPDVTAASQGHLWSGRREDCDNANHLEKGTAGWYDMCRPIGEPERKSGYRPSIEPQKLFLQAKDACGSDAADAFQHELFQQCIMNAKVSILLRADAVIRQRCSSKNGDDLINCVDNAYVYGPNGPTLEELRRKIRFLLENTSQDPPPSEETTYSTAMKTLSNDSPTRTSCPRGQGMKPTPGAFGASSCQPLGLRFNSDGRVISGSASLDENAIQTFEKQVNEVAAAAVVHATDEVSGQMSEADKDKCAAPSFHAVRSVLKGGNPSVPEECRPLASAGRSELVYYASAHLDSRGGPQIEDLLSSLSQRTPDPSRSTPDLKNGKEGLQRTGLAVPATQPAAANAGTLWEHNGSIVSLEANGDKRTFRYERPRIGISAERGASIFEGKKSGNTYSGTAFVFSTKCGKIGYPVEGPVADDQKTVTLRGGAPQRGAGCEVVGHRDDVLVFSYQPAGR